MNIRIFSGRHYYTGEAQAASQTFATASHSTQSSDEEQARILVDDKDSSSLNLSEQERLLSQQALNNARQGKYAEAIALLNKLIHCNPDSATHYNNRGLLHFQNNQFEEALADYDRALQLNPRLAKVYNNRANCYASLGFLAEAIADYETALDLDPSNIRAWINQGITFRDLEMYGQAIDNFDLALRFNQILQKPDEAITSVLEGHIYAERGRTYHLAGDWNCAVADYRRALLILPEPQLPAANVSHRLRSQVQNWLNDLLEPLG
ncbi:tetratricopeptide repeat protein [Leptothermofonsia sp. ETS-13]|uniref:tetratricopeptide repeat protein n=1 Tax=Leptothermofonsia sp. ETS-13 TaxID=3035696 RepID=UPI003BA06D5B